MFFAQSLFSETVSNLKQRARALQGEVHPVGQIDGVVQGGLLVPFEDPVIVAGGGLEAHVVQGVEDLGRAAAVGVEHDGYVGQHELYNNIGG
jgi:hypothetical protein